jgi:hypothetical protein
VRSFVPLALTICTLGPLNGVVHFGAGIVVLGAAVALTAARPGRHNDIPHRHRAMLVPLGLLSVSAVALVFAGSLWAGDALFVVVVFIGTAARAIGPRAALAGRAVMLPLMALFIAPVKLGGHPAATIGWALLAAAVANGWTLLVSLSEPRAEPLADEEPEPTNVRVHMWRGTRSALSMALAFVLGQWLFPDHWTWAVIAAFTIGIGTASRGEAVLKGVQRVFGAVLGTLGATLLAAVVADRRLLSVALIMLFLALGIYLRQFNYLFWAMSITSVLALLYGLNGQTGGAHMLRERILAGLVGGACAIVPAVLLSPIRTRALVLKRAGAALRSVGAALRGGPDDTAALVRRAERDIEALRDAARPLLAIRRFHLRPEVAWVDGLTGALPDLRALPTDHGGPKQRLARTTSDIAGSVRAAAAQYRGQRLAQNSNS